MSRFRSLSLLTQSGAMPRLCPVMPAPWASRAAARSRGRREPPKSP